MFSVRGHAIDSHEPAWQASFSVIALPPLHSAPSSRSPQSVIGVPSWT